MNNVDIKYLVTALVDGEIEDEAVRNTVTEKINSDHSLHFDYLVQKRMKEMLSGSEFHPVPDRVKRKIIKKIKPAGVKSSYYEFKNMSSYKWALGIAAVLLLAVLLIIINRPPQEEITVTASKDMFLEAEQNFSKIADGTLKPQIITSDPDELKQFFAESGVKYSAVIPLFGDFNLVGGVVSEENGIKLAHYVYSDPDNHLVYIFQVYRSYIYEGEPVSLPPVIKAAIEVQECYVTSGLKTSSLVTMMDNNVLVVISDLPVNFLKAHFCAPVN